MSSDIYAEPDLSKKVRYSRKEQEDGAGWEQREVDIYESTDVDYTEFLSQEGGPQTQNLPPVQKGSFRNATLGQKVLFLLMLAGIIILFTLYILVTLKVSQLETKYDDISKNYTQLQTKHFDILGNVKIRQLQTKYDNINKNYTQLQNKTSDLTANMSQLQRDHDELSKNHSQLQGEVKKLNNEITEKWCPEKWMRFGCSCYFKSSEIKTWSESRRDCQDKGADLVIINSAEEQKFIHENMRGESWIGLRYDYNQRTWKWKWVDGSPLTKTFWEGEATDPIEWYFAACYDSHGKWMPSSYFESKSWICEKRISCFD